LMNRKLRRLRTRLKPLLEIAIYVAVILGFVYAARQLEGVSLGRIDSSHVPQGCRMCRPFANALADLTNAFRNAAAHFSRTFRNALTGFHGPFHRAAPNLTSGA